MAKGIVIRGSKGVRIENSTFKNLDTAVEAENTVDMDFRENKIVVQKEKVQKRK